jgi:hypothetical protein
MPIYLNGRHGADMLLTIGDAAKFITRLPGHYDGIEWRLAGGGIEAADRFPDNLDLLAHATRALLFALEVDGMLQSKRRQRILH